MTVASRDWVPVYLASPTRIRVCDLKTLNEQLPAAKSILKRCDGLLEDQNFLLQVDSLIEPFLSAIRGLNTSGAWPPCPSSDVISAAVFGSAIAMAEKGKRWHNKKFTHPAIHVALFMAEQPLIEEGNLGAALAVEAGFVAARSGIPWEEAIAQ
jgi:hypothetical protein